MSRPGRVTNQDAKAFAVRHNQFGRALKDPSQGGPIWREYHMPRQTDSPAGNLIGVHTPDFIAEHPRYPDYAYPDDQEEDTRIEKKMAAKRWIDGTTAVFNISDKDIDYLERKKEAQQLLKFKSFVEDSIPRGTPWARDFFEKIMPGWYQTKQEIIQDKFALLRRYAEIAIHGPRNIDDMFVLYQFYQGNIRLDDDFQQMIGGRNTNTLTDRTFHSGFFGPRTYLDKSLGMAPKNQMYMANISIPGIDIKWGADAAQANYGSTTTNVQPVPAPTRMNVPADAGRPYVSSAADTTALIPEGARQGFFPAGFGYTGQVASTGTATAGSQISLGRRLGVTSTFGV